MSYAMPISARTARLDLATAIRTSLRTEKDPATTLLRVALGAILFPHGAQHLFGWFGGYGFSGTLGWMTSTGIPAPLATVAILVEFFAPIALVLGVGGRYAGVLVAVFMAGAAKMHLASGFFMNWFGQLEAGAEGFEFHLLMIAMALAIAIRGSGALSVDRWLTRQS